MALLSKIDYFGLSSDGWEVESTSENKSAGYVATAQKNDGFVCAIDAGPTIQDPEVNYICTKDADLSGITLGKVITYGGKKYMLGSITINTNAGQYPTMTASGKEVEANAVGGCKCQIDYLSVSHLYHAQTFDMFELTGGQLNSSTLTINSDVGTAVIDGVVKSSDLVGGSMVITGTVVGVDNAGEIATPTINVLTSSSPAILSGCITKPLSQTNPNGDFPTYDFEITYSLQATH